MGSQITNNVCCIKLGNPLYLFKRCPLKNVMALTDWGYHSPTPEKEKPTTLAFTQNV
jgi:hypothetical protein